MKRKAIWENYYDNLYTWANNNEIKLPSVPEYCTQSYHLFYALMPSLEIRNRFIDHLKQNGIISSFHYLPLHLSKMGRKYGGKEGDCPITESISNRLVRLPMYFSLDINDIDFEKFYGFQI